MYKVQMHKRAQKNLKKAPEYIKRNASTFVSYLTGEIKECPFPIKQLQGKYKKYKYREVLIGKDYRIFFRIEGDTCYIRHAGTHNQLGTG